MDSVRLDKWLWAVRVYKTRSQATEACRSGHVKIGQVSVKAAREVRLQEIITVRLDKLTRTLRVTALIEKRVSGTQAKACVDDLTPPAEYEAAREMARQEQLSRPKGMGRPTKKDRRLITRFVQRED
jgi:ribosome-associated heat shock protein Hsp15